MDATIWAMMSGLVLIELFMIGALSLRVSNLGKQKKMNEQEILSLRNKLNNLSVEYNHRSRVVLKARQALDEIK